jgi:hypothetical protein
MHKGWFSNTLLRTTSFIASYTPVTGILFFIIIIIIIIIIYLIF